MGGKRAFGILLLVLGLLLSLLSFPGITGYVIKDELEYLFSLGVSLGVMMFVIGLIVLLISNE